MAEDANAPDWENMADSKCEKSGAEDERGAVGEIEVEVELDEPAVSRSLDSASRKGLDSEVATSRAWSTSDPITSRVESVLQRRLNQSGPLGNRKLKEMGGADAGVRRMIARDLNNTWPNLNPPFNEADISGDDTLSSISREVRRRL